MTQAEAEAAVIHAEKPLGGGRLTTVARHRRAPVIALAIGLLVQLVLLFAHARTLYFWGDDFDFLFLRSLSHHPVQSLMRPHNGHWSTLPVLAFRLLFSIFGLGHYLPYALMPIAAQLVIGVLLYVVLRQAGVAPWTAVLGTLVALFLTGGAGAQNTLWDFQVGFLGSAMFGLAGMVLLRQERRLWKVLGVVALVLALMSSGIGILMTLWAGLDEWIRRGWKAAVRVIAVPVVVQLVWEIGWAHGSTGPRGHGAVHFYELPGLVAGGIVHVWDAALTPGAGVPVLIILTACVLLPRHDRRLFALAASGLVVMVAAYVLFGESRLGLFANPLSPSRYVYFGLLFSAPALTATFVVVARSLRDRVVLRSVVAAATALATLLLGIGEMSTWSDQRRTDTTAVKRQLVAAVDLAHSHARTLSTTPLPKVTHYLRLGALMQAAHTLPPVRPTAQDRLEVSAALQTGIARKPYAVGPTGLVKLGGSGPWQRLAACASRSISAGNALYLRGQSGGTQVAIHTSGGSLETQMLAHGEQSSVVATWVRSGTVYVGLSRPDAVARISLSGAPVRVCPVS